MWWVGAVDEVRAAAAARVAEAARQADERVAAALAELQEQRRESQQELGEARQDMGRLNEAEVCRAWLSLLLLCWENPQERLLPRCPLWCSLIIYLMIRPKIT